MMHAMNSPKQWNLMHYVVRNERDKTPQEHCQEKRNNPMNLDNIKQAHCFSIASFATEIKDIGRANMVTIAIRVNTKFATHLFFLVAGLNELFVRQIISTASIPKYKMN
jgi:hypothetical protein